MVGKMIETCVRTIIIYVVMKYGFFVYTGIYRYIPSTPCVNYS